ncbi:hypothetical protein QN277_023925 [Acacia crassicarpa]|uniref:Cyanobacterial aminoacyl-tRNA synthetase CAAD domain-containing protein n=1 Tax=Acacia crassicarpa TaxID=499986 RepID=A0AAE1JE57_9FABA|nr:hypothetical protein QN277_023925 [Acacia crassicarpa]
MASTSSLSSCSTTIVDRKAPRHSSSAPSSPQCVSLPSLPPPSTTSYQNHRPWKATAYCRKVARNVMAMATGEASTDVATTTEPPEFLKTVQETWEKIEDKYAVSTVAVAGVVALWGSVGVVSAIDRLPLIPGVFEVVGIGYSGWFAYKNLLNKPDREALLQKIKDTYNEIIGSSG